MTYEDRLDRESTHTKDQGEEGPTEEVGDACTTTLTNGFNIEKTHSKHKLEIQFVQVTY